jgi:hypothetical protein
MASSGRCNKQPSSHLLNDTYSSSGPLSSTRNLILTVRSTEVVRLALSSGHPILRHWSPLGPWAPPRRSPLCESHGTGGGSTDPINHGRFQRAPSR